ncbi:5'-deoxynucleotidase [Scatolibacter rhodanostii]|uniref:5'-deoxynucleotidase n=1 Tax=Scatolibacter rhodanostii TaxID=2014781 RepID=UPI000C06D08B|nr:5'-deoxynucleotidase [Scatolibacter rhodanostii]
MPHHFFAMLYRMKYINRWGLMKNTRAENISEHSLDTAMIAHSLALIGNRYFGKSYPSEHIAMLALFHDCTEIITGDLPTPVKYHSPGIRNAYKEVEKIAANRLLELLPEELQKDYEPLLAPGDTEKEYLLLVKAADKLSALAKCMEEKKSGNTEFYDAEHSLLLAIHDFCLPEAEFFLQEFLPSYLLTLDKLK